MRNCTTYCDRRSLLAARADWCPSCTCEAGTLTCSRSADTRDLEVAHPHHARRHRRLPRALPNRIRSLPSRHPGLPTEVAQHVAPPLRVRPRDQGHCRARPRHRPCRQPAWAHPNPLRAWATCLQFRLTRLLCRPLCDEIWNRNRPRRGQPLLNFWERGCHRQLRDHSRPVARRPLRLLPARREHLVGENTINHQSVLKGITRGH